MKREIVELREVVQKLVPLLTGKGLRVTQRGAQAYVRTDPVTKKPIEVNIPNISDNASDSFVRAVQGFIDHEVAHVLITDWNFYGGGPTPEELKRPDVQRLMHCHNIIEDTMIEREIVKIFPGSKKNIADLREHFIRKITRPALEKSKSPEETFSYLMVPVMRALAGHEEFQEFMDKGGHWSNAMIEKLVKAFNPQTLEDLKTADTTEQTLSIAKELYDILYKKKDEDNSGSSQDKPDKQAGQGDGDGERDHSNQEQGDDSNQSSGTPQPQGEDDKEDNSGGSKPKSQDEKEDEKTGSDDGEDAKEKPDDDAGCGADGPSGENEDEGNDENSGKSAGEEDGEEGEGDRKDTGSDNGSSDGDDKDGSSDGSSKSSDGDDDGDSTGSTGGSGDDADDESESSTPGSGLEDNEESKKLDGNAPPPPNLKTDGATDKSETPSMEHSEDEGNGGNGVGVSSGKAMFEFEEDVLDGRDLSEEIMVKISEEAVEAIRYAEWSAYSREWDRVEPLEVPDKINNKWVPEMEEEVRAMTGRMQKDIERIMASQSHVVNTPGHKRGRLHSPSLYRVSQGDPRVFTQKQESVSKDTAVTLLVDNSGSMSGKKMRAAMLASYALSVTLDRVKISHEMMGFTTGNQHWIPESVRDDIYNEMHNKGVHYDRYIPLVMPIYKSFDERLNATVKRRVAYSMNAQNGLLGNIDGECLQIAAERLSKRSEKRKVMLVLSDGQPVGGRNSGPHLKGTVKFLNEVGIETIGIGIMTDAVKRYYENHVVLYKVEDLPGQVMTEIKRLLA